MCAAGLPQDDDEHALNVIKAAIDMQQFITELGRSKLIQNLPVFKIRIGIHSGSVISGVVGTTKFVYDIWGETVNLASQMEQQGVPGKINISGYTYDLIKEVYNCEHRGKIATKNKVELDMYFVNKQEAEA
jgi:class 3 adenylate cyclase